ncbi:hypothetical protein O181_017941 [Austropuccinia psidii MF-1]|uniref:Uncharacterized protein n=1 Tax=Austropuccinia psidii MF-1 TaxID=1389203 RepID=A0A9Q3GSG2_9BASI|nr:hypothetical protein [Austropuccinia psidii MF-1]
MKSPTSTLCDRPCSMEPEADLNRTVKFGIKGTIKIINPSSKINPRGDSLQELTFEKYSDGLQLLNLATGKIRVYQEFTPTVVNLTLSMNKLQQVLPTVSSLTVKEQILALKLKQLVIKQKENPTVTNTKGNVPSIDSSQVMSSTK